MLFHEPLTVIDPALKWFNDTQNPHSAWSTIVVMDVWHWTSMMALLCYAGLKAIPDAYYQAARIDGEGLWSVFA